MFINAHLRPVLHGFETFVPQRAEFLRLHQRDRLVDMTNNGVSAWADFRDAASLASTPESFWDHHNDDFGDNENTSLPNAYHRYHQDISTASQAQASGFGKVTSPIGSQGQLQGARRLSTLPACDEQMVAGLSVFDEKTSAMTGHECQNWGQASGQNNHAKVSSGRTSTKSFQYQPLSESCLTSLGSTVPLAQPQPSYPYGSAAILDESFNVHQTSPNTEYSTYSSSTVSSAEPLSCGSPYVSNGTATNSWWQQELPMNSSGYQVAYTLPSDGLPKLYNQQRQLFDSWNGVGASNNWTADSAVPKYISPKQVPLERLYVASSAEPNHAALHLLSDSGTHVEGISDFPRREILSVVEPKAPHVSREKHRSRHVLPESSSSRRRNVPILRSNDFASSNVAKRRSEEIKSRNVSRTKTPPESFTHTHSHKNESSSQKIPLKRIEPKPVDEVEQQKWDERVHTSQAMHHRDAKDEFLVKSKLAGMSYKDIRRQGKFTEAESTLRGRFRTLTKHKNARVRKPEWDDNDIRLLKRAARKLVQNPGTSKARIPWKQVAEYIASHGGSYHFGNATCRKKWDELHDQKSS